MYYYYYYYFASELSAGEANASTSPSTYPNLTHHPHSLA